MKHGPFFAVVNPDGQLRTDETGDPYLFKQMGPHDNHSKHGRRVERAFVVTMDESEQEHSALRGAEVRLLREEIEVLTKREEEAKGKIKELEDTIARCTSVNISAAAGEPMDANATFQGVAVQAFAAHMAQWFDKEGGKNFVTLDMNAVDGRRFELTMQRAGGETPAQKLSAMRALLEEIYNADREATEEMRKLGIGIGTAELAHRIEDILGLPSTKPKDN